MQWPPPATSVSVVSPVLWVMSTVSASEALSETVGICYRVGRYFESCRGRRGKKSDAAGLNFQLLPPKLIFTFLQTKAGSSFPLMRLLA